MQSTQGAIFLILLMVSLALLWMAVRARRAGKRLAFRRWMLVFGIAAIYPLLSVVDIYTAPDPRETFHHVVGFHPGPEVSRILVRQQKGWLGSHRAFLKFNAGPDLRMAVLNGLRISQAPRGDWKEFLPREVPEWWQLGADSPTFKAHYSVERQITDSGNTKTGKFAFFAHDTATGESFVYVDEP